MHFFCSFAVFVYEGLKIRRQRRQRQSQGNRLNLQNKNFARDALGFVHFFTITARLHVKTPRFVIYQDVNNLDDEIFFLILNLDMVLRNSILGEFLYPFYCRRRRGFLRFLI